MTDQHFEKKRRYTWDDTIKTFIFAVVLAVLFRSFAYEPFHIPSGSMKSNLLVGDYLFVSKFAYGYSRYSFPLGLPLFEGRILDNNKPERGDVAVFRLPSNPRIDYIKRIIGMPGDRVQVKGGIVYINDQPLERHMLDKYSDSENPYYVKAMPRFEEVLPEGKIITILKERNHGAADDTPVYEIPQGFYFMMGDNRDNSRDSRFSEVGLVPEVNMIGRAEIIFFSTDGSFEWLNPISWFTSMRFDRFFKLIE
jgi:signal peptidase I